MAKRGRPLGHKLSEITKEKIRRAKLGSTQKIETREKIAVSVKLYHERRYTFADELLKQYGEYPEAVDWIKANREALNESEGILTFSRFKSLGSSEWPNTEFIENTESEIIGPEDWIILQEIVKKALTNSKR